MTSKLPYDDAFYAPYIRSSETSASVVVPRVVALLNPGSVVDVGCGEGIWLSEFARHGATRLLGVDGDHVNRSRLRIPVERFVARDLSKRLDIDEIFDLAVSLEVAEHLPPESAAVFVASLVGLAKAVLFSAAVPYQGGIHHVNLQWQDYWAGLFAAHGYAAVDAIRPAIWQDASVSFWYRQNTLLYVEESYLHARPPLADARKATRQSQLSVVHPELVKFVGKGLTAEQLDRLNLRHVLPRLPRMIVNAVAHRLARLKRTTPSQ
jgi:SAM-dependent methyltransferase